MCGVGQRDDCLAVICCDGLEELKTDRCYKSSRIGGSSFYVRGFKTEIEICLQEYLQSGVVFKGMVMVFSGIVMVFTDIVMLFTSIVL